MSNSKVINSDSKSKARKRISAPPSTRLQTEKPTSPAEPSPTASATDNPNPALVSSAGAVDLTAKIKELVRLAQEQGYLTYNDINDALPDSVITPEAMDEIYIKLRNLEVEISKRIESAENEIKRIIYGLGFTGKEHIALAEKLVSDPPKERFDRVILDKKVEGRDNHLRALRKLVKEVRAVDQCVDDKYAEWQNGSNKPRRDKWHREFKKLDDKLQRTFHKFYYKQKVIEEMALVADNIHDKIQLSLRTIQDVEIQRKSAPQQAVIQ